MYARPFAGNQFTPDTTDVAEQRDAQRKLRELGLDKVVEVGRVPVEHDRLAVGAHPKDRDDVLARAVAGREKRAGATRDR